MVYYSFLRWHMKHMLHMFAVWKPPFLKLSWLRVSWELSIGNTWSLGEFASDPLKHLGCWAYCSLPWQRKLLCLSHSNWECLGLSGSLINLPKDCINQRAHHTPNLANLFWSEGPICYHLFFLQLLNLDM